MGRLRFLMAPTRRALYGVLLLGSLSTVAAASSGVGTSMGFSTGATKVASVTKLKVSPWTAHQTQTVTLTARVKFGPAYAIAPREACMITGELSSTRP